MNRITSSTLILTFFILIACEHQTTKAPVNNVTKSKTYKILDADILGLVLNPAIFNHHYVRVRGYLNIGPKKNGLYLHEDDFEKSMDKSALWVDTTTIKDKHINFTQFSGKYVLIEGKFDAYYVKDMSNWNGKLTDIKKIELLYPDK